MTLPLKRGWIPLSGLVSGLACIDRRSARSIWIVVSARQRFNCGQKLMRASVKKLLGSGCFLLGAICMVLGCGSATEPTPSSILPPADPAISSGAVTIRFDGIDLGSQQEMVVDAVAEGTTVEAVMQSLDGPRLEISGGGLTAFLHGVNGLSNEGDRGWTFLVDGKFATAGMGSTKLSPPTEVVWRYGAMEDSATVTEGTSSSSGRN